MSFLGDLVPYFQTGRDGEEDSDASSVTVTANRYDGTDDREDSTRVRVPRVRIKKQREEETEEVDEVVRSKKIPLQIRRFGLPDEGHRVRLV